MLDTMFSTSISYLLIYILFSNATESKCYSATLFSIAVLSATLFSTALLSATLFITATTMCDFVQYCHLKC